VWFHFQLLYILVLEPKAPEAKAAVTKAAEPNLEDAEAPAAKAAEVKAAETSAPAEANLVDADASNAAEAKDSISWGERIESKVGEANDSKTAEAEGCEDGWS
jgi:hypothetical protein